MKVKTKEILFYIQRDKRDLKFPFVIVNMAAECIFDNLMNFIKALSKSHLTQKNTLI